MYFTYIGEDSDEGAVYPVCKCYCPVLLYFVSSAGNATRFCVSDDTWGRPDVSQCENVAFTAIRTTVSGEKIAIMHCVFRSMYPNLLK